jgi:protein-disulfide isomerase
MTRGSMAIRLGVMAAVAVVAVIVAVVIAGGGGDDGGGGSANSGGELAALKGVPQSGIALGSPDAPVTMVEFADLQCPFCAEYQAGAFPELLDRYVKTGKLRIELRLLRFIGPDSDRLARVAAAAAEQNRMWQFVDLAFARQGQENSGYATDEFINKLAADAGLGEINAGAAADRLVQRDEQLARSAGIDSTPSFLIGPTGGKLTRFQPNALTADAFIPEIDKELAQ